MKQQNRRKFIASATALASGSVVAAIPFAMKEKEETDCAPCFLLAQQSGFSGRL